MISKISVKINQNFGMCDYDGHILVNFAKNSIVELNDIDGKFWEYMFYKPSGEMAIFEIIPSEYAEVTSNKNHSKPLILTLSKIPLKRFRDLNQILRYNSSSLDNLFVFNGFKYSAYYRRGTVILHPSYDPLNLEKPIYRISNTVDDYPVLISYPNGFLVPVIDWNVEPISKSNGKHQYQVTVLPVA